MPAVENRMLQGYFFSTGGIEKQSLLNFRTELPKYDHISSFKNVIQ